MPVSTVCPNCGAKLGANTVRLAWCVEHQPVRDWMCWNAVMRLYLPVQGVTLALVLLLEALLGGAEGVTALLRGNLLIVPAGVTLLLLAGMLLVFILQGEDLLDCVIDARGIHVQRYLPEPTALRLLLRGKSPRMLDTLGEDGMLLISSGEIAWKDIQRVQLWPEKTLILFYAPRWWMRLSLPCTPFTWEDALSAIRDKLGRKKAVILPAECRAAAPVRGKSARQVKAQQLSFDDVPPNPIPAEDVPPDEPAEDFTALQDVLRELREGEE